MKRTTMQETKFKAEKAKNRRVYIEQHT